jgi:phage FluMu protein Com
MDCKTAAHTTARHTLDCVTCDRPLLNAKYEGEFLYPLTIVYLLCQRCRTINEATINTSGPFYNVATEIDELPRQATRITSSAISA